MQGLFRHDNTGVSIDPNALMIKEFRRLLERDRTREKRHAYQELAYVYFYCDYKMPYSGLTDMERHEAACSDAGLPTDWKPDKEVQAAIDKYKERRNTDVIELLLSAKGIIHKLRKFYDSVDFTELNAKGEMMYNPAQILASIKGLDGTITGLDALIARVKSAETEPDRQRGGGRKGFFEDPDS